MNVIGNRELLQSARDAAGSKKVCQRISLLIDKDFFRELDAYAKSANHSVEVVTGFGYVDGLPIYVFTQDSEVDGGAVSKMQAHKTHKLYDLALKTGTSVVGIYDSVGGHLKERTGLLAVYGDILLKDNNLSGVVPQVSVVLGPCAGISTLIVAGADFVIMAENATLTIETADENGSAKTASRLGLAHWVEKTEEDALDRACKVLCHLSPNNLSLVPEVDALGVRSNSELQKGAKVADTINAAVDDGSYMEFCPEYGTSVTTGLALINGASVGVAGYQDIVGPCCCSKVAWSIRFCDAFSLLIVTIVDVSKFTSLREAAKPPAAYSEATTIKITMIPGQAAGAFYIITAGRGINTDMIMAWTNVMVSPISPAAAALFQSSDQLAGSENLIEQHKQLIEDYRATQVPPLAAAVDGYVEDIILPEETHQKLVSHLEMLAGKHVSILLKKYGNIPM